MKQQKPQPARKMAGQPAPMYMADGGEVDVDDAPLKRQPSGFLPPNACDETQGPGVRGQQDYRK